MKVGTSWPVGDRFRDLRARQVTGACRSTTPNRSGERTMRHDESKEQSQELEAEHAHQEKPRPELSRETLEQVVGGGGWGQAQYQYGETYRA
jgi:hypothetical protein